MWGKELKSIRVLLFGVNVGIMAVLCISFPVSVYSMSSRPPVIPERLEDGDYLQESYLDHRKILIFDKDGKVKGFLKRDLMDSRKFKFVKE